MKFSARILAWIFVFFVFICWTPTSLAQSNLTANKNPNLIRDNVDSNVPNTLHNWTQTVMIETLSSLSCQLTGIDPINPQQACLGVNQKTNKIGFLPSPQTGGVIGFMGNMIAVLYTPPAHTSDYFQNLAQNFGISKKTYAANTGGAGFQSITSLIGIWSAFRNIVYLLLVLIFVIIGLAIMLRIKIDPRTVMTIQNQIPKIIIGILAITFSFAIAGFLIDFMWILIYLLYNIMSPIVNLGSLNPVYLQSSNPFNASTALNVPVITLNAAMSVGDFIQSLFPGADTTYGQIIQLILTTGPGVLLANPSFYGSLGGIIAFIIITIAVLTALFRLWFTLIKAYVQILLDIVLAPFWIIGGIIPGSHISLSGWLKDLAANLLAFPVIIAMFMLGKAFMDIFGNPSAAAGQNFVPPLIGNPIEPTVIGSLISLGIILMTPKVLDILKQALKLTKIDTGIGAAIGGGVSTITSAAKQTGSTIMSTREYIPTSTAGVWRKRNIGEAIAGGFLGRRG